jgi:hypothetical protein
MIKVEYVGDDPRAIVLKLKSKSKAAMSGAERGVAKATIALTTYIKEELLSGQVLNVVTGNLRRAVYFVISGLIGIVSVGPEAPYAKFQEYGVDHSWVIEAKAYSNVETHGRHSLHFNVGGADVFASKVTHPGLKERSFMRRGLVDQREEIIATIRYEVNEGVNA